ncbi:GNAT family N-acetyltransferase [candidate division KSB1 bacterium]|nr:GNAT family N-acetyltransferase [candidate division KSB1 bacterium]RQW09780.1 MAG: N-acetyltransferase [candidate division KSB1 bacterium]
MGVNESTIQDRTLEALARTFFKESIKYGFRKIDYLRFVNFLLDMAMSNSKSFEANGRWIESVKIDESVSAKVLPLESERLRIRSFQPADAKVMQSWLQDDDGRHFLLSRVTAKSVELEKFVDDKSCLMGIITLKDDNPIGAVAYCNHNPQQHRAELRKIIGDPAKRAMGYAKEATQLWIQYGIQTLGLKKIYLSTLNSNIRNIKLNEELGFQVEGILRNEVYFDNKFHDLLRMGMFID